MGVFDSLTKVTSNQTVPSLTLKAPMKYDAPCPQNQELPAVPKEWMLDDFSILDVFSP